MTEKKPLISMTTMRWGIVVAATLVLAVAAGGRFLIGIVFDQVRDSFQITHGTLGLVVTLNVLVIAITQPLVGWLVDKMPARYVTGGGMALVGIGLVLTGVSETLFSLFFGYGLIVALGLAAVSPVAVTPVVAGWFQKKRATALSIVNAGGSVGQLAIVPALTVTVGTIGWQLSYIYLGIGLAVIGGPLLLLLLREREETSEGPSDAGYGCNVYTALKSSSFWMLGWGFLVCGITMAWVMTFFVDYALLTGLSRNNAAVGLSLMGGMSIIGALMMGWWADRSGKLLPLAVTYALRGGGFVMLFVAGASFPLMLIAMTMIGISWTATVPLTSAISADLYGRLRLGTIFGMMFAVMPLGSAIGSAAAGFLYDLTGSYDVSLWMNAAIGIAAGIVVYLVHSRPLFDREAQQQQMNSQTPAALHAD
ncbi:MAG: MFS transporter [Sphaerobacteraceae bacterium]|nr:MAG: MFS transporter [Sphaerobacteraceae bacterium]